MGFVAVAQTSLEWPQPKRKEICRSALGPGVTAGGQIRSSGGMRADVVAPGWGRTAPARVGGWVVAVTIWGWVGTVLAPEAPRFERPERGVGAGWLLRWTSESGVSYRLESSPAAAPAGLWTAVATVRADGPVVRYDDLGSATGSARFYRVVVAEGETQGLGDLRVGADSFVAGAGGTWIPRGTVTVGRATIPANANAVLDPVSKQLSGQGTVTVTGWGAVATGAFVLDGETGWLKGTPPTEVALHPELTLHPRTLEVNVTTGALRGEGRIDVSLATAGAGAGVGLQSSNGGNSYVAVLDGEFTSDPAAGTLRFEGNASYRDVTLTGAGQVTLAEAVFDLAGSFRIGGPGGAPYALANGVFRLRRPACASLQNGPGRH